MSIEITITHQLFVQNCIKCLLSCQRCSGGCLLQTDAKGAPGCHLCLQPALWSHGETSRTAVGSQSRTEMFQGFQPPVSATGEKRLFDGCLTQTDGPRLAVGLMSYEDGSRTAKTFRLIIKLKILSMAGREHLQNYNYLIQL